MDHQTGQEDISQFRQLDQDFGGRHPPVPEPADAVEPTSKQEPLLGGCEGKLVPVSLTFSTVSLTFRFLIII